MDDRAFSICQAQYDAQEPEDPEEVDEREARRLAKVERQIDDYEDKRRW